jgi:site-specific recombinase XerD
MEKANENPQNLTAEQETEVLTGEVIESEAALPISVLATIEHNPLALLEALPLSENPAAVYIASLGEQSRRVMLSDLNRIAFILSDGTVDAYATSWGALRFQHTAAIRAALSEQYNHNGANRMLSALRGALKAAWRLGQMQTDEYQKAIDIGTVKGESLAAGRALSAGELRTLFSCLAMQRVEGRSRGQVVSASRDAAEIAVLYGAGLRRGELVGLDLADFNQETGALTIRHGKGNKARIAYATNGSRDAIAAWLEYRGDAPGPLFGRVLKSGRIVLERMTGQAVLFMLAKRAKEAGIKDVSPHDFRRTFISDLLDAGADIVTVQKLAGHAKVDTTAKYDRRGEVKKQKAAELLHVPFVN